jgi:hypothetical protein
VPDADKPLAPDTRQQQFLESAMTEFLAILTSLYVVYVLYEIFKTVSESDKPAVTATFAPPPVVQSVQAAPAPTAPVAAVETVAAPKPVVAPAPAATDPHKIVNLRNPATGEVSPVPGNYRFAKKWIKEAMVTEGLLNKVYKNSELTEAVNPKLKAALEDFKKLEKYQA